MVREKGSWQRCSSWTALNAVTTALSSGFPLSQGNADALDRWGGKTKHRLISYFLSKTSAKNYRNRIVYVKIIACQRWDVFLETQCIVSVWTVKAKKCQQVAPSGCALLLPHMPCTAGGTGCVELTVDLGSSSTDNVHSPNSSQVSSSDANSRWKKSPRRSMRTPAYNDIHWLSTGVA